MSSVQVVWLLNSQVHLTPGVYSSHQHHNYVVGTANDVTGAPTVKTGG